MKIWNICVSRVVCQFLKDFVSQLSSGSQSSVPVLGGCHWHCAQEWHTVICPYPCGHVLVLLSSASARQDWKLIRWVFLPPPPLVPCALWIAWAIVSRGRCKVWAFFFYCLDIGKASFPEKLYSFLSWVETFREKTIGNHLLLVLAHNFPFVVNFKVMCRLTAAIPMYHNWAQ